jgi:hypothetical protein
MSAGSPDVVGASRQMEKCEECRKGNVKQKVRETHLAEMSTLDCKSLQSQLLTLSAPVYTSWSCLASP